MALNNALFRRAESNISAYIFYVEAINRLFAVRVADLPEFIPFDGGDLL